jgi:hypothetical protein
MNLAISSWGFFRKANTERVHLGSSIFTTQRGLNTWNAQRAHERYHSSGERLQYIECNLIRRAQMLNVRAPHKHYKVQPASG